MPKATGIQIEDGPAAKQPLWVVVAIGGVAAREPVVGAGVGKEKTPVVKSTDSTSHVFNQPIGVFRTRVVQLLPIVVHRHPGRIDATGDKKGIAEKRAAPAFGHQEGGRREKPRGEESAGEVKFAGCLAFAKSPSQRFHRPDNVDPFVVEDLRRHIGRLGGIAGRGAFGANHPAGGGFLDLAPPRDRFAAEAFPGNVLDGKGFVAGEDNAADIAFAPVEGKVEVAFTPPRRQGFARIESGSQ